MHPNKEIKIEQTESGFYKATAIINYTEELQEFIDFNDGDTLPWMRPGETFLENPADFLEEFIEGYIGGMQPAVKIYTANVPEMQRYIHEIGKEEIMKAIKKVKAMRPLPASKPRTQPTQKQIDQMLERITELVDTLGYTLLEKLSGYDRKTLIVWKNRGRCSADGANNLCKVKQIKALGFTRESLRPDIEDWSKFEG